MHEKFIMYIPKGGELSIVFGAIVLFCFLSLIFDSGASGGETVVVDKSFNKREIKVRIGGSIRVELEELGSAGYAWKIKDFDNEHFEVVSVATKDAPSPSDVTGVPVVKTWLISAKKEGLAELKFLHYRPWEGEQSASDSFSLKVRVLP